MAITCCTNMLPNRPNSVHRITASSTSANSDAKARFQPCLTSGTTTGSTASARNRDTTMSMTRYAICPQERQQKLNTTMAMAMYSRARPSHSGGLLESPFAGNRVPRSQRCPSSAMVFAVFVVSSAAIVSSVVSFMCRTRSLMAPYCSDRHRVRTGTYSCRHAERFNYHPCME